VKAKPKASTVKKTPQKTTSVKKIETKKTESKDKPDPKVEEKPKPPNRMMLFAAEYIIDFNLTHATERAGYKGSEEYLAVQGSRLIRNDKVVKEIERLLTARNKGRELRKARVTHELENIAFDPEAVDIQYDKNGKVLKVSRTDKLSALKMLGQQEGMFTGKEDDDEGHGMGGVILLPLKMLGDAWAQQYSGEKQ